MRNLLIGFAILVAGCTSYALVESGPQKVKAITIEPPQAWNKVPSMFSPGGVPTWTADGISLNSIAFFSQIKDGEPLISGQKKEGYAVFRADMLPTELVEIVESTVAKLYGATISSKGDLRPLTFGGSPGFEYDFEFLGKDELPRRAYVAGTVKNSQLHMVFYQAARMHYYNRHLAGIAQMVKGASID